MLAALLAVSLTLAAAPAPLPTWTEPATGMEFVEIPAGTFTMGSPADEPGRTAAEVADEVAHRVTLTRSFWLGRTEVTQGEWRRVMGTNPSHFAGGGDRAPVERVNRIEALDFLSKLEALAPGNRFRLPTEAEWEYACRAGTTTAYPTGRFLSTDQANYDGRYPLAGQPSGVNRDRTVAVASFAPNPWGLYDMNGNVWEWTADDSCPYPRGDLVDPLAHCASGLAVIRGGSFYFNADSARCALRYTHRPVDLGFSLGFRVVREVGDAQP